MITSNTRQRNYEIEQQRVEPAEMKYASSPIEVKKEALPLGRDADGRTGAGY